MIYIFSTLFPTAIFVIILTLITTWACLKLICLSNANHFKYFYVSSGKSTTNARLLGGLAISVAMIFSISSLFLVNIQSISLTEQKILLMAIVSISLVTFYGYFDDKYEVRVRYKLTLQLLSVLSFSYLNAPALSPGHRLIAFFISSIFGLAFVNGANLLDGLDSLSVKLGITSSMAFLYLSFIAQSPASIYLSLVLISSLSVFYFFNREPAKIYMGEIGGSLIGLTFFVQSSICFSQLKFQMNHLSALALVLIAGCSPLCELGISCLRRIWFKKSPFAGDKLHLHYVVKNKYKLSANSVSSRMGIANFILLGLGFSIAQFYNPVIAVILVIAITIITYLWFSIAEWRSAYLAKETENLFKVFEGKTVNIIDSTDFGSLNISVSELNKNISEKKKSA